MGSTTITVPGGRAGGELLIENAANRLAVVTVVGSSSYATGGDACDLTAFGGILGRAQPAAVLVQGSGGYDGEWITSTKKLKCYVSGGTEVSSTTNLSTITFFLWVLHY